MTDTQWAQTVEYINTQAQNEKAVGVSVGIFYEGREYFHNFGVTSVDNPLPINEDTLFQIGSITKTYTTTLIMQLVEEGKLSLDDRVRQFLPDLTLQDAEVAEQVTLRHLLTHTGGWDGDLFVDTGMGSDAYRLYIDHIKTQPQLAPPGKLFSYNNSGFGILALILEQIYAKPLEQVMHERIFAPLRMQKTFVHPIDVLEKRFALGHNKVDHQIQQVKKVWPTSRSRFGTGSIHSSARDQLQYAQAYLNGGSLYNNRILSEASIEQMSTKHIQLNQDSAWGIGWAIPKIGETFALSHGGSTAGQLAHLSLFPERAFAMVILTNGGYTAPFILRLRAHLTKEYLGLDMPKPTVTLSTPEQRQMAIGVYKRPLVTLEIGILGDSLVGLIKEYPLIEGIDGRVLPPFRLDYAGEDSLIILDGDSKDSVIDIARRDDGTIGWLRLASRLLRREA